MGEFLNLPIPLSSLDDYSLFSPLRTFFFILAYPYLTDFTDVESIFGQKLPIHVYYPSFTAYSRHVPLRSNLCKSWTMHPGQIVFSHPSATCTNLDTTRTGLILLQGR